MSDSVIRFPTKTSAIFAAVICCLMGCSIEQPYVITFVPMVGGEPLEYGAKYEAPNGDGTFSVTDFMFYVSNIQLLGDQEDYRVNDSYHLVKFQDGQSFSIPLDSARGVYDRIRLSVGIDKEANLSPLPRGDLNPTNQMAWNWTAGYKFLLLEGKYRPVAGESVPLIYHIGFSENKRDMEFALDDRQLTIAVDINGLFAGPHRVDFHELPEVLFNEEHAAMIADNYSRDFLLSR